MTIDDLVREMVALEVGRLRPLVSLDGIEARLTNLEKSAARVEETVRYIRLSLKPTIMTNNRIPGVKCVRSLCPEMGLKQAVQTVDFGGVITIRESAMYSAVKSLREAGIEAWLE